MKNLLASLKTCDAALLPEIARFWKVSIDNLDPLEIPPALEAAMLDPDRAARAWDALDDAQRGTLQTLIGGLNGGKMTAPMFSRMFGEIRKMGRGLIEKEKPLLHPISNAEALYYRGLIYEDAEKTANGLRPIIYIPADFSAVLPNHKTAYDDLGEAEAESLPTIDEIDMELLEEIHPADTTIVDDMTTLLAYLQIHRGTLAEGRLAEVDQSALIDHFMHTDDRRLDFLFKVGVSAELIDIQDGLAFPRRAETRRWLESTRSAQLKYMAEGWRESRTYLDLWHVDGLHPEPTGWSYDPALARREVLDFLREGAPLNGWWGLDEFISVLKDTNPDFQRPGGDYDTWYIRSDSGEYLRGFESWDAVEGALLEYYFDGPMHWLGLVDLAEDAVKLTAYGRAFVTGAGWPAPSEPEDKITVQEDGTLLISRKVSRFERFQAMRFTDWAAAARDSEPFIYKLNGEGIRRAAAQNINTGHIAAFISRMLDGEDIPPPIARLLEVWESGSSAAATLERLLVLRTTAPETMDFINETPALRRYLGARLGPMAVIVRADQWEALRDALGAQGITVEVD